MYYFTIPTENVSTPEKIIYELISEATFLHEDRGN